MSIELRPVRNEKTKEIVLYDIFIDGQWLGSRRTVEQCEQQINNYRRTQQ